MLLNRFLNHNLSELIELGLLQKEECNLLGSCGFHDLDSILTHYRRDASFYTLNGCTEESAEALRVFSESYFNDDRITAEELFSDAFHNNEKGFVPVEIEWNTVSERNHAFLNTWINYVVNWYAKPQLSAAGYSIVFEYEVAQMQPDEYTPNEVAQYMTFGRTVDAKTFYEKALLHPVPVPGTYGQEHQIRKSLFYLRNTFLKFYKAVQTFSDPFDLFRFFAKNEFFIDCNHTAYQRIKEQQKRNKEFPFARTVYEIVSNSSYLNRPRRMKDMNMVRFVSIFDKSPYSFEDLHYLFGMSQKAYDKLKKDCNAFAENGCRITIAILKALGFKTNYDINAPSIFAKINNLENLYLPGRFYDLLLEEL